LFAHRIVFLTTRAGYAEYVCEDCGHPFCFAVPQQSKVEPTHPAADQAIAWPHAS
jgi:hypothetical protein